MAVNGWLQSMGDRITKDGAAVAPPIEQSQFHPVERAGLGLQFLFKRGGQGALFQGGVIKGGAGRA